MNLDKLASEEPRFIDYARQVMDELTGCSAEEWVYLLWKSYQQDIPPSVFVKDFKEGKL